MSLFRIPGDAHVEGHLSALTQTVANSSVGDAQVKADAAIQATKLTHQHLKQFSQPNTAATAVTQVIHEARAAGTIVEFRAGSIAACAGDATITVDLKKNGATVLSAVITLDNANSARVAEAGTISSASYVAGDVLEIVVAVNAGTGTLGTGLFAQATLREAA